MIFRADLVSRKRRPTLGVMAIGLITVCALLSGCNTPHTPDAVVGNQGTKDPFITGARTDGSGRVVANPSTGAGKRKELGN